MNNEEALHKIREIFAKNFNINPAEVQLTSKLYEELGLDSLDAVDLVLELQEITGKKIKPEVFKGVRTVSDVVMVVISLQNESGTEQ